MSYYKNSYSAGDTFIDYNGNKYTVVTGGNTPSTPFDSSNIVNDKIVWGSLELTTLNQGGGSGISTWTAGTQYNIGDNVIKNNILYQCITANSDSTWTPANWQKIGDSIFTGATSSSNGVEGIVPQPTTSDVSNFLCGDGTWKSAGGSSLYVNRDVLFSGNTAIAENAVINLTKPYTDYDYLLIEKVGSGYSCFTIEPSEFGVRTFLFETVGNGIAYFSVSVLSQTQIKLYDVSGAVTGSIMYRITGIKFTPNPNNYSTTEQEIGTWIDGKPLYQKTYTGTSVNTAAIPISINIDTVVEIGGCTKVSGVDFPLNYYVSSSNYGNCVVGFNSNTSFNDRVIYLSHGNDTRDYNITIKYTKV